MPILSHEYFLHKNGAKKKASSASISAPANTFVPTSSKPPLGTGFVSTVASSLGVTIGEGRVVLADGTVIDGVTGTVTKPGKGLGGCTTCGPVAAAPVSMPMQATATGFIDVNPTLKIDGTVLAAAAFFVWLLFFRK